MDAEILLESVFDVLKEIAERHPDIAGMGVTSFGETFVLADEKGMPLHKAMLYTDPRGAEECRELVEKIGGRDITSITGVKPHEMYSLPKIMWMKRNRPKIYQKARHIFLMEDLVVFALTGVAQIDYSLASRTMGFDILSMKWNEELFRAAGTTLAEIYLACMEGVVYEMVLNMEYLNRSGVKIQMLHATGGGAKSEAWMQMKADMLNIPITALKTVDAGTAGSAMLTGIVIGCYNDLEDAAVHMVEKTRVYYPRAEMHEKYQKIYKKYRKLYEAVRPLV